MSRPQRRLADSGLLRLAACIAFALHAATPLPLHAHGDLHEQIDALTRQIAAEPENGALFLKRGELHRLHQEWAEAAADYDRASALHADSGAIDFARAKMLFESGRPQEARQAIGHFLTSHPNHADALLIRARAEVKLEELEQAAKDFSSVIALAVRPEPELYLERAAALAKIGADHSEEALASLNEGITRLGPLVTLGLAALDLEIQLRHYDAALARIDLLSRQSQRKESWLNRRGEILALADRPEAAREAFQQALAAIESLPQRLRFTASTMDLEARIRRSLAALPAGRRG